VHAGLASATELFASVTVRGEGPLTSPQPSDLQQHTTSSIPVSLTASVNGASAFASADFRVWRVQGVSVGTVDGYNPAATARARSLDVLTIMPSDVSLLGTTGTLVLGFDVDGTFSVNPINPGGPYDAFASASLAFNALVSSNGSSAAFDYSFFCRTDGGPSCTPVLTQNAASFVFGAPFVLQVEATANGSVGLGEAFASSDYANTIRWAGFDSILDAQGQPISGFSVLSDSGFDYAAVPEPATAALVMMGMLTLATRRRSK